MDEALTLFDTRILDFRVSPTSVVLGEPVTISGRLEKCYPLIGCWPFAGAEVRVYADTREVGVVRTDDAGGFRYVWYPPEVGAYWVKSRFPGDAVHKASESQQVPVTVVSREERERELSQLYVVLGIAALAVVAGMVAFVYVVRQ